MILAISVSLKIPEFRIAQLQRSSPDVISVGWDSLAKHNKRTGK